MADERNSGSERSLIREMGITPEDMTRRLSYVGFTPEDGQRVTRAASLVAEHIDELVRAFFDFLSGLDETRALFASPDARARAIELERQHVLGLVGGKYGEEYVEQRLRLGLFYSKVGLESRIFIGAFHHLMRRLGTLMLERGRDAPAEAFETFMAVKKIAFLDIGLVIDVLVFERERVIRQQQEEIRELSTPVLQIRDRLLLLPIIGVIDTHRARLVTEGLLLAIRDRRARVVVMDVTGVATIDSRVANHLMQTIQAAKLMGAQVIVTGLSSSVAQSLVALGIGLGGVHTAGDLQGGLEEAERTLGYRVTQGAELPRALE